MNESDIEPLESDMSDEANIIRYREFLADGGWGLFSCTPKGVNHAYKLYENRSMKDGD